MEKIKKIIKQLKIKGVKVTPQRIAIINYLENTKSHPTAEVIFENVSQLYPTISLATIYNTLEKLEEINEIKKIKISDESKVNYDSVMENHHHFYCKKCKKIFDLNVDCTFSKIKNFDGNIIDEVHGYFKGTCKDCLSQK